MGLDNGIILTVKHELDFEDWDEVPEYVEFAFDYCTVVPGGYEYDVCYWRKCWDVRYAILDILGVPAEGGSTYRIETPMQITQIQDVLIHFLEEPGEWGQSIWTIKDMAGVLAQQIMNLTWLRRYMEEHRGANIKVEFYDSY